MALSANAQKFLDQHTSVERIADEACSTDEVLGEMEARTHQADLRRQDGPQFRVSGCGGDARGAAQDR
jgi:hypothetical protein